MPIYEYECNKCGVFELTRGITEPAIKRCPTCKGKVDRLISNTSFVLKGSGWYATDYAKSGTRSTTSEEKTETASSTNGAESKNGTSAGSSESSSKSESKPEKTAKSDKSAATNASD